jgi:hypothetical protein
VTIAYVDAGAVARQAGDASPATIAYPAATADQNLLLLAVLTGSAANGVPTTPAGWDIVHSAASTSGVFGSGTGPRRATVFSKIADGTEGGTTFLLSWDSPGGAAVIGAQIHQFSKTEDEWVAPAAAGGEDTTLGSGAATFSVVTSALALDAGDLVFAVPAAAGDAFMTAPAISAAGITFGSITERAGGDSSNGRVTWCFAEAAVTAGAASGAVTMTWDIYGDSTTGAAMAVRLREAAGGEPGANEGDLAAEESGADTAAVIGGNTGAVAATEDGADGAEIVQNAPDAIVGLVAVSEAGNDTAAVTGANTGAIATSETGSDTAEVTNVVPTGASAAEVWAYVMPNGMTAGEVLMQTNRFVMDLARVHGLLVTVPLVNTQTTRTAGTVVQDIVEAEDGTITVTRRAQVGDLTVTADGYVVTADGEIVTVEEE